MADETLHATWFKESSTTDKSKEEFIYYISSGITYRGVQKRYCMMLLVWYSNIQRTFGKVII